MQSNQKKIGIFIIILGLVIILLIIYFFLWRKTPTGVVETPTTPEVTGTLPAAPEVGTTTPSDKPRNYQKYNAASEAEHKVNANDLGKISMSFAARFGSFSNQSNYSNFTDLKAYGLTSNMEAWVDKNVSDLKSKAQGSSYYGIVTDAITFEVKSFDDNAGRAEILVATQRRESTEKINGGTPYSQNLSLSLVKANGEWLFDKAYWESK